MRWMDWRSVYKEIRKSFPGWRRARIDRRLSEKLTQDLEVLKKLFIEEVLGDQLKLASDWSLQLKRVLEMIHERLGVSNVVFPRELRSFLEDPQAHLRKKLFIYAMDLARRRLKVSAFEEKGRRAIQTSLQTNLRSIYQSWVFLTILYHLAERGGKLIYPECGYLSLERSGKQRLSSIPPNAIIETPRGSLSFFLEAPRPIAWEDTEDLKRVWKLYRAMRPDILVYGGRVMDILDGGLDPPIKRPDVIIEVKELEDWHKRVRELRSIDRAPSAEEWRWMWLQGLWRGLGRELGARTEPEKLVEISKKKLKLKEPDLIKVYMKVYQPKEMILVTRCASPRDVRERLEEAGVKVVDDVGFDQGRLIEISEEIMNFSISSNDLLILEGDLVKLIREKSKALGKRPEELLREIVEML